MNPREGADEREVVRDKTGTPVGDPISPFGQSSSVSPSFFLLNLPILLRITFNIPLRFRRYARAKLELRSAAAHGALHRRMTLRFRRIAGRGLAGARPCHAGANSYINVFGILFLVVRTSFTASCAVTVAQSGRSPESASPSGVPVLSRSP